MGRWLSPQALNDVHIDLDDKSFHDRVEESLAAAIASGHAVSMMRKPSADPLVATHEYNAAIHNAFNTSFKDGLLAFKDEVGHGVLKDGESIVKVGMESLVRSASGALLGPV